MGLVEDFLPHLHRAHHIHIHDNHGQSDEHLPLGAGTINWEKVGREIAARYSGTIVIEGRSLDEARISLAAFRRWFP
jgi:sugar phosphate isomerase/epimerase